MRILRPDPVLLPKSLHAKLILRGGEPRLARGGGEAALTGSRVRERKRGQRGATPANGSTARTPGAGQQLKARVDRDAASAVAKRTAVILAAHILWGGGARVLESGQGPCRRSRSGRQGRRSREAPPPLSPFSGWPPQCATAWESSAHSSGSVQLYRSVPPSSPSRIDQGRAPGLPHAARRE